jgi:uncharacterized membrane protein
VDAYALLKLVHILSAAILFGTGLGTAFFMWRTQRGARTTTIATVAANVVLADWLFTTPAVVIQPLSGLAMVWLSGYSLSQSWLIVSLLLYLLAGACWLPVVWLQRKMRDLACQAATANTQLPPAYFRYFSWWFALGWPAFSAVIVIFYLMVFKPVLW